MYLVGFFLPRSSITGCEGSGFVSELETFAPGLLLLLPRLVGSDSNVTQGYAPVFWFLGFGLQ